MQFIKDKDLYKAARITGPTHNLLAIRLSDRKCSTKATALPTKQGETERLDSEEVLTQVLSGLEDINRELGREYFISEIQFIPSDSKPTSTYRLLVRELIKRIDEEAEFVVV